MKTKSGSCCGEHAQPIPSKGHPHAMHFILLLAGMGLIYSVAGVILLTNIYKNDAPVAASAAASNETNNVATPITVEVPSQIIVSVEVI